MDIVQQALQAHEQWAGKLRIRSAAPVDSRQALSLAYTPGVAEPCRKIAQDASLAYTYTRKWNTVAVVTDGTAVLGLGDIGPTAALPVMEGKCVLFSEFAGIDALPICIDSKLPDDIVRTVQLIAPSLGGINLEDISAPRCFEVEQRLKQLLDIPVFHDDQHGTAVVVTAGLINACKIVGKSIDQLHVVVCGLGAAGSAIAGMLLDGGVADLIAVDRDGILTPEMMPDPYRRALVARTNHTHRTGGLQQALQGADVFVGVSAAGVLRPEWVAQMAPGAILFAMANPQPEIDPDLAAQAGAAVVGTGRSDYPNQVNNVLAFPGIFRGVLDVRASDVSPGMKWAAAHALAGAVPPEQLSSTFILPNPFEPGLSQVVAAAVADAARAEGLARI